MAMDSKYSHKDVEPRIYKLWEDGGYFKAERDPAKTPYTIILPPPNASGKMHMGNVLMIAIEDILIRWKRMQGFSALWIPGTDHAGFETQTTFERELKKEGKSRLDFDRNTLYQKIWDFVQKNRHLIEGQIRQMGASIDWSRYSFTLDPQSLKVVQSTFEKMHKDGLIYRDDYVVNYSFKWGTTFSDAEIVFVEQNDPLYYIKYGPLTVATVRPETKWGDTALAVNPNDERYKNYIGQELAFTDPLGEQKLTVIADSYVDPAFGTGVLKVTPAHDKNDYEIGLRHGLQVKSVIGLDGRMNDTAGKYKGLKIMEARKQAVEDLTTGGLIEKVDATYTHTVPVDYRSNDYIEMLPVPNWFIKVDSLKKKALEVVQQGELTIYPQWREITYTRWVENMRDWAISRQVVWGIRIPAWYSVKENPTLKVAFITKEGTYTFGKVSDFDFAEVRDGLQRVIAPKDATYVIAETSPGSDYLQETDTFDTWFSSGQWPLITLGYPDSEDFKYFYPTNVLETGWEIVTRWVSRMVMFGIYATGKSPFKDVYLHGMVRAVDGKKMSKSLGNNIDPDDYLAQYGVDALRMGLIFGTANGKDFAFPKDKVVAYRNFANKIWNMARFFLLETDKYTESTGKYLAFYSAEQYASLGDSDRYIVDGLHTLIGSVDANLAKYRFADAAEGIYHFMWDELASKYLEELKAREDKAVALCVFRYVFLDCLKLLHPFMPFISEEIWANMPKQDTTPLIVTLWPTV
jgi:valyl-tRNA synthetase